VLEQRAQRQRNKWEKYLEIISKEDVNLVDEIDNPSEEEQAKLRADARRLQDIIFSKEGVKITP